MRNVNSVVDFLKKTAEPLLKERLRRKEIPAGTSGSQKKKRCL
jgi:hypothetical protein